MCYQLLNRGHALIVGASNAPCSKPLCGGYGNRTKIKIKYPFYCMRGILYWILIYTRVGGAGYSVISGNTLKPRQNGRHIPDDIFKCIFLNEYVWIRIEISLKFVPKGPTNNIPALVQVMAWLRPGDKPLSESMMVSLPTHICVTRPQWVNSLASGRSSGIFKYVIFQHFVMSDI